MHTKFQVTSCKNEAWMTFSFANLDTNNFENTEDHQPLHPAEGAPRHHHEAPSSIINHRRHTDHHKYSKFSIKDELQDKETGAQWDPF